MKIRNNHIPYLVLALFGILFLSIGILNHYFFRTFTHDYGNYNFAFWDYSHFRLSPIPTFRGNFLQDHFSFTLMYFAPTYWLFNWLTGSYTLIIIQCSFILIGAWYTYKLIKLKTNNIWLNTGVLIYYFVLLGRYTAFSSDVNLAIISSCFIPIFIYYFEIRKYLVSLVILILSLLSRENIPLWFIFIFIVLAIEHRKESKVVLYCLAGIAISTVYFILLFKVFIPAIETPGVKYALFNYSALGSSPGEALLFSIKNPLEAFKLFFINHLDNPAYDGVKTEFYWVYLISGGFVLLTRPQYLIWFIPIVAQKVLNDLPSRWGIATYYSIEVVTLLPLAVFLALSSFKSKTIQNILVVMVCLLSVTTTIYKLDKKNNQVPRLLNTAKVKFYDKQFFIPPFDVKEVNRLLKKIPPKAKVSASNVLLPHIAQRQHIYFFPVVKDAEYLIFSVFDNNYLYPHSLNEEKRNEYLSDPNWDIIAKEFPVFLLKRKDLSNRPFKKKNLFATIDSLSCSFEGLNSTEGDTLLSMKEKTETKKYLSEEKPLSGLHSIKLTNKNKYSTRIYIDDINRINYLEISAWYYGSEEKQLNIVADYGKEVRFHSNVCDSINPAGWKRLILKFWVPKTQNKSDCSFYFVNSGTQPVYYDDLLVTKKEVGK
ncbi:DUF2079 domain-containing protein [Mariniphaga anaerophila]|nr:DUF2079 domain-containing protein [Mariniphaga anaerophila]